MAETAGGVMTAPAHARALPVAAADRYPHLARVAGDVPLTSVSVKLNLAQPTNRRGVSAVTLRPGVIDDEAHEVFTYGYCYLLACALHEVTGWPFGIIDAHQLPDWWQWVHVGVITSDGRFVDVRGPRDVAQVLDEWRHDDRFRGPFRLRPVDTFAGFCAAIGLPGFDTTADLWASEFSSLVVADTFRVFADVLTATAGLFELGRSES